MSLAPIGAIIIPALPTLLAAEVPKRWLPVAILLWIPSPAIVFFALDLIGKAIGTPAQPQPGNSVDALLLAGSYFLIPWILTCVAGFGIGFAIRAWLRRPPQPSQQAPPLESAAIPAPIPIMFPVRAGDGRHFSRRQSAL